MRVYLSRWVCLDVESNLRRVAEESEQAVAAGARLVVFPESFLHGYSRTVEAERVRQTFSAISAVHPNIAYVFGSFTEERRNRTTVWRAGDEVARYDKVHLFAANDEARLWDEGDRYAAVRVDSFTWGLVTCNDLRFPEQSRALRRDAGCEGLLVVAWWPWRRDHVWRTLLRARAIENGVWVVGCCVAASEFPAERFAGAGNYVFDPHGEPVRTRDDRLYDLDPARAGGLVVDPVASIRDILDVKLFTTP